MRSYVYIDGFNLYYRMLKARPALKWLNPLALAKAVLKPEHVVERVNYYSARISARAHDPDAPARQAIYRKALASMPEIVIHDGNFMMSEPWMPLTEPAQAKPDSYCWRLPPPDMVKVQKSEEKGSDVNLAAHLVRDACQNRFEAAVVLTNDSDLVEPIRIATQELGKRVGLLAPVKYPTASLLAVASFTLHVRPGHLAQAQFPSPLPLIGGGEVHKPESWI